MTGGRGLDSAFEVVGLSSTLDFAIKIVRKGGFVKLVGNLSKEINFPLQAVVTSHPREKFSRFLCVKWRIQSVFRDDTTWLH